jgi:hypothetical protein
MFPKIDVYVCVERHTHFHDDTHTINSKLESSLSPASSMSFFSSYLCMLVLVVQQISGHNTYFDCISYPVLEEGIVVMGKTIISSNSRY